MEILVTVADSSPGGLSSLKLAQDRQVSMGHRIPEAAVVVMEAGQKSENIPLSGI